MKKIYLLLGTAFLLCCLLNSSFAQDVLPASATWPLTDPATEGGTGLTVTTEGQIVAEEELLHDMELNQYTGPGNSQRLRIAGNEWPANQSDTIAGVYVQFAMSPKENNKLQVTNISFDIAAASIGTMKAEIYYSTDPSFKNATLLEYSTGDANNYLSTTELTHVDATVEVAVEEGETFYLRIYPWVEDPTVRTGKYVTLQNVVIEGQTESLPVASSVVWNSDDTFTTTGAIMGEAPAYSDAMKYYGSTELKIASTDENVTVAAIQTVSKDWQAETDTVGSLYFQYAATPKFGATLNVTSISLYIGGWFSSNLRASIYYSKDLGFASSTPIVEDMVLPADAVELVTADLDVTVNTGETFYLRIYPYNLNAEGWAKLIAAHEVTISGTATGVTFEPPTVTTTPSVSEISTSFATSGGNISSDGGAAVTERGVVWNTTGNATIENDSKTSDGEGSGAFTSTINGLAPGTTYYVRAYATNSAGTSYGEEITFTTLEALTVPTVSTRSVSNILVESAQSGGSVTAWGGAAVTARGVVWNTTGNPTLEDNKTVDGDGIGSYNSLLYPLAENTTYYVRAYATNSEGTGYGEELSFTTQEQQPDVTVVVAKDGSGDYTTVQAAFDAVPDFYTGKYTIFVKPGEYYEKLILERNKINVVLRGEDPETTILTYDDYAGKNNLGTSGSYSVAIEADDFTAVNITFRNTVENDGSQSNQQAVALRVNGDRQAFYNCHILGYQDTFYAWGGRVVGRIYMKDCYIEGSVDFIFGRDIVVFDHCTINVNRDGGMLTAASTEENTKFGFVFLDCTITTDELGFDGEPITSFHLGRPWQAAPRTVFMRSELPANLDPAGWRTWNVAPALYGEYNNTGPGADVSQRIDIARVLTEEEAAEYTIANIFSKETHPDFSFDWMPEAPEVEGAPAKASVPSPANEVPDIETTELVLGWTGDAETYNLYWGTSVENLTLLEEGLTATSYSVTDELEHEITYFWRVDAVSNEITTEGDTWSFTTSEITGIEDAWVNSYFELEQNYPNPADPSTRIPFTIKKAGYVNLILLDAAGKKVAILVEGYKLPDTYEVALSGKKLAGGVYYYQLSTQDARATRKLIVSK